MYDHNIGLSVSSFIVKSFHVFLNILNELFIYI